MAITRRLSIHPLVGEIIGNPHPLVGESSHESSEGNVKKRGDSRLSPSC